jgi:GGDEF domain-containing protein
MTSDSPPAAPATPHPADRRRRASDVSMAEPTGLLGLTGGSVSFRVRRLEPQLAFVIAGYTVWVSVLTHPPGVMVWVLALFAACIGGWSSVYPARQQQTLLLRAVLLTLGVFLLHLEPDLGGPTGPYFFWPLMVSVFYALLLSTPGALLLIVLTIAEYALACWLVQVSPAWRDALLQMSILVLMPPLALAYGKAMRQSDARAESSLRDHRTLLYNETGFFVHGSMLLADCHKRGRPFSMVLLNGSSLRDLPGRIGRKMANDLFGQVVQGIGKVPGDGIAARTDPVEFALLLPNVTRERAVALVRQQLGNPPKVEVWMAGEKITVDLDMVVMESRNKERSLESLYDMMHTHLTQRPSPAAAAADAMPPAGPGQLAAGAGT